MLSLALLSPSLFVSFFWFSHLKYVKHMKCDSSMWSITMWRMWRMNHIKHVKMFFKVSEPWLAQHVKNIIHMKHVMKHDFRFEACEPWSQLPRTLGLVLLLLLMENKLSKLCNHIYPVILLPSSKVLTKRIALKPTTT